MTRQHMLDEILTEFDPVITSELNVDPLGLLVIWSAYGQGIFRRRISSISNDVRNYTLNLFNHAVTKGLVEDDQVFLRKGLHKGRTLFGLDKDSIAFKQACLIYMENLFAYSMVEAQNQEGVETVGVLGISKARRRWEDSKNNPRLLFSHEPRAHVLVRQNSLGVSGRYKTPLVEMKFFDSRYDYELPECKPQWEKAIPLLNTTSNPLKQLHKLAQEHLAEVATDTHGNRGRNFLEVPHKLRRAFVKAFRSPEAVGAYAREFWLSVTELNQGAPGALYEVLNQEWRPGDRYQNSSTAATFTKAVRSSSLTDTDRSKLEYVCALEPFLSELDLLIGVMLSSKSQSLSETAAKWTALGRDGHTLPNVSRPIKDNAIMLAQISGTAGERLKELLALTQGTDLRQHMERLLKYHDKVMQARGQSPWLRLLGSNQLKIDVRARPLPTKAERPLGTWVNQYYIPQFRLFLSGLRGAA